MAYLKTSRRYAKGLLSFAQETQQESLLYDEMKDVAETVTESRELQKFLSTPIINDKKKKHILHEIFSSKSEITKKYIDLLVNQKRAYLLAESAQEYIKLYDELNGIMPITITTAETLTETAQQSILTKIKTITNCSKFKIKTILNPEIIGGFIVNFEDKQYDQSIRSELDKIKENLKNHPIN